MRKSEIYVGDFQLCMYYLIINQISVSNIGIVSRDITNQYTKTHDPTYQNDCASGGGDYQHFKPPLKGFH